MITQEQIASFRSRLKEPMLPPAIPQDCDWHTVIAVIKSTKRDRDGKKIYEEKLQESVALYKRRLLDIRNWGG